MSLDSHDHVEVDAAIYATSRFCAKSQYVPYYLAKTCTVVVKCLKIIFSFAIIWLKAVNCSFCVNSFIRRTFSVSVCDKLIDVIEGKFIEFCLTYCHLLKLDKVKPNNFFLLFSQVWLLQWK